MSPSSLSASLSLEDDNHAVKSSVVGRDDDLPEMDLLVVGQQYQLLLLSKVRVVLRTYKPAAG